MLYRWGVDVAPLIFNFWIKWRRVVVLNPSLLYPRERALNSLYLNPGGSQCPVWIFWRRKQYLAPVRIKTQDRSARNHYTDYGFIGNLVELARDWHLTCSGYGVGGGDYWAQLVVGRVSGGSVLVWKECTSLSACLTEFPGNYNSPNAVRKISVGRLSTTPIPTPTPFPPPLLQGLCSCPVNWVKEGLVTFAVKFLVAPEKSNIKKLH